MEIDIYERKYCPICGSETLLTEEPPDRICKNGCTEFLISITGEMLGITIYFDERIADLENLSHSGFYTLPLEESIVLERIAYWRENERYLMMIMGVHDD